MHSDPLDLSYIHAIDALLFRRVVWLLPHSHHRYRKLLALLVVGRVALDLFRRGS